MELHGFIVSCFFYSMLFLYNLHGQSIYSKIFFMPTMDKAIYCTRDRIHAHRDYQTDTVPALGI